MSKKEGPQELHKMDFIDWEGNRITNDIVDYANNLHREDLLAYDKDRIKESLRNMLRHIHAFNPVP